MTTWSCSQCVLTAMVPLPPVPCTASATACAALTMRFSTTWLMLPATQLTGGSAAKSVARSATYLNSLRASVSVSPTRWLRSTLAIVDCCGWANSLSDRAM